MKMYTGTGRKKIRLSRDKYTLSKDYFVTICTQNRECLFSTICNSKLILNPAGKMVENSFYNIEKLYKGWSVDCLIVMPNHIHTVVKLEIPPDADLKNYKSLIDIIRNIKTFTTHEYIKGVNNHNWPTFNKRLWQRNYYEVIVPNDSDLNRIRKYIYNNPRAWSNKTRL